MLTRVHSPCGSRPFRAALVLLAGARMTHFASLYAVATDATLPKTWANLCRDTNCALAAIARCGDSLLVVFLDFCITVLFSEKVGPVTRFLRDAAHVFLGFILLSRPPCPGLPGMVMCPRVRTGGLCTHDHTCVVLYCYILTWIKEG